MKVRSFSVVAATCLAGTEASMKVRSLSVVAATCIAGAEAVAIGARDPSLGSMLNGLFGGGAPRPPSPPPAGGPPPPPAGGPAPPAPGGPGGVNTAKPFDFGGFNKAMGGIERELNDAANPTKPSFFGFGPEVSVPLSPTQLANDLDDVQDAVGDAQKFLNTGNVQIPQANQAATCTLVSQVLKAETALLSKINTNLASPTSVLSKSGAVPSVGKTLGQSSKSIDSLVNAIAVVAPLCQANANEGQAGVSAVFESIYSTARALPTLFSKGFIKDLLEFISLGGGQSQNPVPSSTSVSVPTVPPTSSVSAPATSTTAPSSSIPPVALPSVITLPVTPSVITLPVTPSVITLPTTSSPVSVPTSKPTSTPSAPVQSVITLPTTPGFITLPTTSISIRIPTLSTSILAALPTLSVDA